MAEPAGTPDLPALGPERKRRILAMQDQWFSLAALISHRGEQKNFQPMPRQC